jgi:hypothetical protein
MLMLIKFNVYYQSKMHLPQVMSQNVKCPLQQSINGASKGCKLPSLTLFPNQNNKTSTRKEVAA